MAYVVVVKRLGLIPPNSLSLRTSLGGNASVLIAWQFVYPPSPLLILLRTRFLSKLHFRHSNLNASSIQCG